MRLNRKKTIIIAAVSAIVMASAMIIWFFAGRSETEFTDLSESELLKNQPQAYTRKVIRDILTERVDKYIDLPEQEKRVFLDKTLADMQNRVAEFRNTAGQQNPQARTQINTVASQPSVGNRQNQTAAQSGSPGRFVNSTGSSPSPSALRAAAESVGPQERARYAQFYLALRKRGQELGIDVPIPIH